MKLVRVVDGDTIIVDIEGWPPIIGEQIGVRVSGCDTPELRDKRPEIRAKARCARDVVKAMLQAAGYIELRNIRRGKYFRIVADVYADGYNLADLLISAGHALPYAGGTKQW